MVTTLDDRMNESATTETDIAHLRYGLTAVYHRDTDPAATARRRAQRSDRRLNTEQAQAYQQWLDEQQQDAS